MDIVAACELNALVFKYYCCVIIKSGSGTSFECNMQKTLSFYCQAAVNAITAHSGTVFLSHSYRAAISSQPVRRENFPAVCAV